MSQRKSRIQSLKTIGPLTALAGVPTRISATDLWVKSFLVQGLHGNTDFVFLGDSVSQPYALEPRRSLAPWGDNLDNGTGAQINLRDVFFLTLVNGEGISVLYLEGA